jgi:hypothetical protein
MVRFEKLARFWGGNWCQRNYSLQLATLPDYQSNDIQHKLSLGNYASGFPQNPVKPRFGAIHSIEYTYKLPIKFLAIFYTGSSDIQSLHSNSPVLLLLLRHPDRRSPNLSAIFGILCTNKYRGGSTLIADTGRIYKNVTLPVQSECVRRNL